MISIFTHPAFLGNRHPKLTKELTTLRISSRIRGDEIAEYLGAKLNPKEGFEDDICIHVKPKYLERVKDGHWVDYLDSQNLIYFLKERPLVNVISHSQVSHEYLTANLTNKVVLIPSHHINIEGYKRERTEITTVGYIGAASPEAFKEYAEIGDRLKEVGLDFKACFSFKTRQDAVDLYRSIDIFIIGDLPNCGTHQKAPTKIINAGSFGIPTIACPVIGYAEIEGSYIHASTLDEMIFEAQKLKDKKMYDEWSKKAFAMADKYHISKIAELYKQLV
jgi:hypothetical protein